MVFDVPWRIEPFSELFGMNVETGEIDSETSSERPNNIDEMFEGLIKSFRLIRLVRIVKLYKYCIKAKGEEGEVSGAAVMLD